MRNQHQEYTPEKLIEEREYGLYWYSWLWTILRPVLIFACSALLLLGIISFTWGRLSAVMIDPVDPQDQTPITFQIKSGESLTRVANNLQGMNLIRNRTFFKYYADFMGFGQKIQAGNYTLHRGMTISQIADQLTRGDGKPIVRSITVIPGWTVEGIADYLLKEGAISDRAQFLEMCKSGQQFAAYYFVNDVLASGTALQRKYALEGYLAPDTYEVYTDAKPEDIIKKLLSQTGAVFIEGYQTRAQELGMSMDQVLALASMIEKEAKTADFARVSGIFHNRLRQKMRLGSDVTVKYVTGTTRMALGGSDLAVDSPYNTYQREGLPIGPICAPSPAAIQAALYPDEAFMAEGYLYFCSKDPDTGELYFSKTLQEHEQAVRVYAPLWEAYDKRTNAQ
ncbi:MAG: endolytic transglycosylase MltG [Eubacteriales bacterium]|nr:endolytic transglycosylase MltG [Eubacteriales bacterium]MDD3571724.1 endolytic transglycosylase MltG [Eubacteriales bacterium]MDD4134823.1 endolytic transglycosylase MltG [Eubacteriales bacterium]